MNAMQQWAAHARANADPPKVDLATHIPTSGEVNNITYLAMKYVVGWPMRAVDLSVVNMMAGGPPKTFAEYESTYVPVLAEYIWDHLCGETDDFSAEDVAEACMAVVHIVYGMDEKARNDTEEKTA